MMAYWCDFFSFMACDLNYPVMFQDNYVGNC